MTGDNERLSESHTVGVLYSVYWCDTVDTVLSPDVSEE